MANDINVVVLVGRLVRDSEFKTTTSGSSVCRFSIAVNRRKKSGDSWEDEVNYFDVVLWGKSAENLHKYLDKGRQVSIEGELRQNRWEQDGQTRSKVEIFANNVQLIGGNQQSGNAPAADDKFQDEAPKSSSSYKAPSGPEAFDESDIPF